MRTRIENHYYKEHYGMSGLPLPKSADGKVHDIDFVDCDFHHDIDPSLFVNCTFTDCDGPHSECFVGR